VGRPCRCRILLELSLGHRDLLDCVDRRRRLAVNAVAVQALERVDAVILAEDDPL
jgi:hypothetical protein